MTNQEFNCNISVNITPTEAFKMISRVSEWWVKDVEGKTEKLKDEFTVLFGTTWVAFKITEVIPEKKIVWSVTDNTHYWLQNDKHEWTNTKMIFEIISKDNKTILHYTHEGLVPEKECYAMCEKGWSMVIKDSLFNFITTGKTK